jgi:prepilin-type N-terminal cleavage/methylation domain-containing protein
MKISPPRPLRVQAGFSLIELLAALVILSILSGLAVPRMSGVLTKSRLDNAANQLVGDIAYARMAAVRAAQRVEVEFTSGGYRIVRNGTAEPIKTMNLAREHAGMQLQVEGSTGVEGVVLATLAFDSRGVLRQGGGLRVVLRREGRTAVLDITRAGQVRRAN